jgi:hypothetical protein
VNWFESEGKATSRSSFISLLIYLGGKFGLSILYLLSSRTFQLKTYLTGMMSHLPTISHIAKKMVLSSLLEHYVIN